MLIDNGDNIWRVIGTIAANQPPSPLARWLFRDRSSFPTAGGYSIGLGVDTRVAVAAPNTAAPLANNIWGPRRFDAGAIVDIEFKA